DVGELARRHLAVQLLHRLPLGRAVLFDQRAAVAAGLAAEDGPGLHLVPVAALAAGDRHLRRQQRAAITETAAPFARAARIRHQFAVLDPQRKARFEHFRRIEPAVAVDGDDAVVAVMAMPSAPAAGHDVVAGEILVVVRVVAAEHEVGAGAALRRHHPLGHTGAYGADGDVGEP